MGHSSSHPRLSNTHLLCLQMAFNTFLQCLVFGVLIMAVSQVDGAELDAVAKCQQDCATKHTGQHVANNGNANVDVGALADTTAALNKCQKDCVNGAAGVAITSFTFLLSLAIGFLLSCDFSCHGILLSWDFSCLCKNQIVG